MSKKRALITGITGQDGSYLAEFLLSMDYEVFGLVRRSSTVNYERIAHIQDDINLVSGDMLDAASLTKALEIAKPQEVYNLAAQSFVQTSWNQAVFTGDVTALGVTRLLDAIMHVDKDIRFYQASSSEMFGKVMEVPQKETTPFYPRSPYGVAKVYGHWITVNYRESYDLHATSGILFNHECIAENTPLIIRQEGVVNVTTPDELVPLLRKGRSQQSFEVPDLEVWDGTDWTSIKAITATRHRTTDEDHNILSIEARGGVVEVTSHHNMLNSDMEIVEARHIETEDHLAIADCLPAPSNWTVLTCEMAEFLGLLTADGYIHHETGKTQFTNNDPVVRERVAELWSRLFMGTSRVKFLSSGFNSENKVGQLYLTGERAVTRWLREELYTRKREKRVPKMILNANPDIQDAYLRGYYAGDGLKAGKGDSIKTNSAVLAQGLCWLYANQGRQSSVYVEHRGERRYYQINLSSANQRGQKGQHLRKPATEVRTINPVHPVTDWVFDLETESGVFCAGVGRVIVHNSPRRGLEFVTRKVTYHAAKIKLGLIDKLPLGNLDARRDWGFAGDYVKAMWLMLQQDTAEDFVIATGETHTVERLVEIAFDCVDLNWKDYVVQDPRFMRPAEVDLLIGDPAKAGEKLGWEPEVTFEGLVQMMVEADLKLIKEQYKL